MYSENIKVYFSSKNIFLKRYIMGSDKSKIIITKAVLTFFLVLFHWLFNLLALALNSIKVWSVTFSPFSFLPSTIVMWVY